MWPVEEIPDTHVLYLRVHDNNIIDGKLIPGSFKEHGEGEGKGMSTDWSEYSTAAQSLGRATVPEKNSIVSFIAGLIRYYELLINHAPLEMNRAHTNVKGADADVKKRLKLLNIYDWELKSSHANQIKN